MDNNELSKKVELQTNGSEQEPELRKKDCLAVINRQVILHFAAQKAIQSAKMELSQIDLVIVATITPDMAFPSTACLLQDKLGLGKVACFDIEAACSGFLYALDVADGMLASGRYKCALVIGAEKMSSILDWEDRSTCVLFGDGAGAAVLKC